MPPSEHELRLRERLSRLRSMPLLGGAKLSGELERLQRQLDRIEAEPTDEEIWRSVELARHAERPYTLDYTARLLDDWFELHGDRSRADDGAMVTGLGKLEGRTVALIGQPKGRDIQERTKRQFGMPYPEGYRKANRGVGAGGRGVQAGRGPLPRARRDRRDRPGAAGRGTRRPRRGGPAARGVAAGGARRAQRRVRRRIATPTAGEVPLARRLCVSFDRFRRIGDRRGPGPGRGCPQRPQAYPRRSFRLETRVATTRSR